MNKPKLTQEQIREIKSNSGRGGIHYKVLAKKFGVHIMTINNWANDGLREKSRVSKANWRERNKESIRKKAKDRNKRLKIEVLSKYSSRLSCDCCDEKNLEFLSIDHIGGGGAQHRKIIGNGKLYIWLKKNNFPSGFRVLCFNCNHSYGHYNFCPHNPDVLSKT